MRVLYSRADGGVSVVNAACKSDIEKVLGPLSDDEYAKHVWECSVPKDAVNAVELPDDYQLPEREFRNAWKQNDTEVTHDLEKARAIQLDKIRIAREPALAALDKEFMQCLEKNIPIDDVSKKKQALRDITEHLKSMDLFSINDVKKSWPQELTKI